MRKIILLLLTCAGMWACSEKAQEKKPDNLLSEREMFLILFDAHLGESGLLQSPRDRDSNQALYARYMQNVYKKHHVEAKVFEESYKYYAMDPKKIDAIYLMVVDSLSSLEGKEGITTIPEAAPAPEMQHNVPDSIKQMREQKDKEQKKD